MNLLNRVLGMLGKVPKAAYVAGAGYLGYKLLSSNELKSLSTVITEPFASRDKWISSSSLGLDSVPDIIGRTVSPQLGQAMKGQTDSKNRRMRASQEQGTAKHSALEEYLLSAGIVKETERYIEDPTNKVFGYADIIWSDNIPGDIKTVDPTELDRLTSARPKDVSQTNFYALAMNAPFSRIAYVSRGESGKYKVFDVPVDQGKYASDVNKLRYYQEKYKLPGGSDKMAGFRPISSWFGEGINWNMSSVRSQKSRLSHLPVSANYPQADNTLHPNHYGSRIER